MQMVKIQYHAENIVCAKRRSKCAHHFIRIKAAIGSRGVPYWAPTGGTGDTSTSLCIRIAIFAFHLDWKERRIFRGRSFNWTFFLSGFSLPDDVI